MKQFVISFSNRAIFRLLLCFVLLCSSFSCRKNDHPGFPCDSSGENNADLQNAQLIKFGADVPAKWYALAITAFPHYT